MVTPSSAAALIRSTGRDEPAIALVLAVLTLMVLVISAVTVVTLVTSATRDQAALSARALEP